MKKHKNKKYQSVITKRIFQSVKKLSTVFLVVACASSLFSVGGTNAGFSDVEESTGNTFTATSLDGRPTLVTRFAVTGMTTVDQLSQTMKFKNDGALDFRYGVKYRAVGGDALLCDAFLLTAKRGTATVYNKLPLKDFNINQFPSPVGTPFQIARFGEDSWSFTVELPTDAGSALEHKSCQWNFDFTAWQMNLSDATQGFSDVETVGTHSIATGEWLTAGDVIINEVMWMGSERESNDEWIELKNMTARDIDLSNWDIENGGSGAGHIEIPHGYSIKANGYFLITKKKWNETAINLASDLTHDKGYTHVAGMSLHNNGEQLTLEDKDNNIIDITPVGVWPAGNHGSSTSFEQSMERNDIPGDGLLAASWHTCVSGVCNDGTYWDTVDGNNFGTPLSANLSPIVMNEFVFNPEGDDDANRPDGEWIELYNILDTPIDVALWYFTNSDGDKRVITAANTGSGMTVVPGKGRLVVYLERAFLDNDADTLSLFAPGILPLDESDDVREDTFSYEDADLLPEGKSFARFSEGNGIWLDPEATPGEENVMNKVEMRDFRLKAYNTCFAGETLNENTTETICSPIFLTYIGMLEEADDTKIKTSVLLEILEMVRLEEEQKLLALLLEDGVMTPTEQALVPVAEEKDLTEPEAAEETGSETTPPIVAREEEVVPEVAPVPPVEPVTAETVPVVPVSEETVPIEVIPVPTPVIIPEEEPVVEDIPEAKVEETPTPEPVVVPVIETL